MTETTFTSVSDYRCELGESPIWDSFRQCLWFVDIEVGGVLRWSPANGIDWSFRAGHPVGAVVLDAGHELIVAGRNDVRRLSVASQQSEEILAIGPASADLRLNDGACDPQGRFWVGSMSYSRRPSGTLYRLDRDGVTPVVSGVTVSNGIAWSPGGDRMYYVDTPTHRIDVFDYDPDRGATGGRRVFAALDTESGKPDGLAVDADGGVWVAVYGAGCALRYTATGQFDCRIKLPVTFPTNLAFGGADLGDLYVTSAQRPGHPVGPLDGAVLVGRPGAHGLPLSVCRL